MKNSIKNFLLESESEKDDNFVYLKPDVIDKVKDVAFDRKEDYIKIDFSTTYKKDYSLVAKLTDFKKWMQTYIKRNDKTSNIFHDYLKDFFEASKEVNGIEHPEEVGATEQITEIIDDTNEIMPDQDISSNATGRMVGDKQTMDAEKIFKKSMPKSVRNYSGNLGLGTVVW
jgi:hypothetical protein